MKKNVSDDTKEENTNVEIKAERKQLNYSGLQCPGPIVNISKEVKIFKKVTKLRLQSQIQDSQVILKAGRNKRDTLVKLDGVTMKLKRLFKKNNPKI